MLNKFKNYILSYFEDDKEDDIPKNLREAVQWLEENMPEDQQEAIANEEVEIIMYHHSLGRWIRNNWGLWKNNSQLYMYFRDIGIEHPDDMSGIILSAFQARLRGNEFSLLKEVNKHQQYWKEMEEE